MLWNTAKNMQIKSHKDERLDNIQRGKKWMNRGCEKLKNKEKRRKCLFLSSISFTFKVAQKKSSLMNFKLSFLEHWNPLGEQIRTKLL